MPTCWDNPHALPPVQCPSNTASWTGSVNVGVGVRAIHLTELRSQLQSEFTRRGLTPPSFTDVTIEPGVTKVRKVHVDELRAACNTCHIGDCATDTYYCPGDTVVCADFTDSTIAVDVTKIRSVHFSELRTIINSLKTTCICEAEQCEYCADCGYKYYYCNCQKGCYCDNDKYSGGCGDQGWVYNCGSINTGGTHPYKSYSPAVAWDGIVPWYMGQAGNPPGSNWSGYWTCKCNPFTW